MRRFALFAVLVLTIIVAGCGGSSSSSTSGPVQIVIWHGYTDYELRWFQKAINRFNATHHGVHVVAQFDGGNDGALQRVLAALAGGRYPDIAYIYGSATPHLARSALVVKLDQQVRDNPSFGWSDFWPAAREAATVNRHVVGVPALIDNLALVYNPKLFQAAGVAPPTASWTWDDFRAAAKKLTNPAQGIYGYAIPSDGSEDTTWHWEWLLWQSGGDILTPDLKHAAFASPAGVRALSLFQQMASVDHSLYADSSDAKYLTLFTSGRVGMIVTGPWDLPTIRTANSPFGVQILPGYNGNHQTISGPDNWIVLHHDDAHTKAATTFLQWLTAPQQDLTEAIATAHLPVRRSVMNLPGFAHIDNTWPGNGLFVRNLTNAVKSRPPVGYYPAVSTALAQAIVAVELGRGQPATALAQAAQAANSAIATAGG